MLLQLSNFKINLLSVVLIIHSGLSHSDLLTDIESEISYSEPQKSVTKSDVKLKMEWSQSLENGINIKVIPQLLFDYDSKLDGSSLNRYERTDNYARLNGPAYEDKNHRLELLEAYGGLWLGNTSIRLGKQQVVWGQADGLKVLDVINPQNYREFNLPDFEDSRIPTWMLNLQHAIGEDATLQLLVIPDLTFNELADSGSQFAITSKEMVPQPVPSVPVQLVDTQRPSNEAEIGLRWSAFIDGWDVTANYFNYYQDTPVVYRDLIGSTVWVTPTYEKSQLAGFSANTAMGNWVWKIEMGFIKDNYFLQNDISNSGIQKSDELASVFAFDYHGFSDLMVSYQFFNSTILDYKNSVVREKNSTKHTLLFRKNAWNETLELKLFMLLNSDYNDGQARFKTTYKVSDNWSVFSGVDYFYGDEHGPFGQFKQASRVNLGWQVTF
ncbi:hypothetical protein NBRC116188_26350 [Oceaniserpentilla sp. 4NH20-0058]|uniref:DUF1302 family protein n=1 Tax=Oceaniserpentilla sp. 4NH20-0058 TaxID=3127660 RepID=UPI003107AC6B